MSARATWRGHGLLTVISGPPGTVTEADDDYVSGTTATVRETGQQSVIRHHHAVIADRKRTKGPETRRLGALPRSAPAYSACRHTGNSISRYFGSGH
jgi:hypothetical protein